MVATDLVEDPHVAPERTSTFKVRAGTPMALDLTTRNHASGLQLHTKAIYELDGDHLIYCVGAPDEARPTEFTTTTGDGNTRVVLRRAQKK